MNSHPAEIQPEVVPKQKSLLRHAGTDSTTSLGSGCIGADPEQELSYLVVCENMKNMVKNDKQKRARQDRLKLGNQF